MKKPIVKIIKNAISKDVLKFVDTEFTLLRNCFSRVSQSNFLFNDKDVPNSFSWYSPPCFESLSVYIKSTIENEIGEKIYPTYSYGRFYSNGSKLDPHLDRDSSEIAVSLCIRKEKIYWPLYIKMPDDEIKEIDLNDGDMVIYSGSILPHWRETYIGKEHLQCFMQYVYANGKNSHLKYDKRPCLCASYETSSLCDNKSNFSNTIFYN